MINYFSPSFIPLWNKVTYLFFRFLCFEHLNLRALFMRAKCQQSRLSSALHASQSAARTAIFQKNDFRRTSTNFHFSKYEDILPLSLLNSKDVEGIVHSIKSKITLTKKSLKTGNFNRKILLKREVRLHGKNVALAFLLPYPKLLIKLNDESYLAFVTDLILWFHGKLENCLTFS